jgi:hypothetical protein
MAGKKQSEKSFADRAAQAAELQRSAQLKLQLDAFRKLLEKNFAIDIEPTELTIEHDGVTLRYDPLGHDAVRLVRTCEKCGTKVESHELSELAHLGAALAAPIERHPCKL